MSRRVVWSVLSAVALGAGAHASPGPAPSPGTVPSRGTTVIHLPARTDRLIDIGAAGLPADRAQDPATFPVIVSDTPAGDLGLAAAALANGPVATPARRPVTGQATVAAKSRARLPEPATWLMLIGGMYGIGAALRRRHRAAEAAFTARLRAIAEGEDDEAK